MTLHILPASDSYRLCAVRSWHGPAHCWSNGLVVPVSQVGEMLCIRLILSSNHLQTPQYNETSIIRTSIIRTLCLSLFINISNLDCQNVFAWFQQVQIIEVALYSVTTNELFQFVTSLLYRSQRTLVLTIKLALSLFIGGYTCHFAFFSTSLPVAGETSIFGHPFCPHVNGNVRSPAIIAWKLASVRL